MNQKTRSVAAGGIIAALYAALSLVSSSVGLSSGAIQLRLSEALCILPCFTPAAIPGLFLGCILANLFSGCVVWDIIFGSLATLIGAIGTRLLKKKHVLSFFPPILANAVILPFVLIYAYRIDLPFWLLALSIGIGEGISCGILGELLFRAVRHFSENIVKK